MQKGRPIGPPFLVEWTEERVRQTLMKPHQRRGGASTQGAEQAQNGKDVTHPHDPVSIDICGAGAGQVCFSASKLRQRLQNVIRTDQAIAVEVLRTSGGRRVDLGGKKVVGDGSTGGRDEAQVHRPQPRA